MMERIHFSAEPDSLLTRLRVIFYARFGTLDSKVIDAAWPGADKPPADFFPLLLNAGSIQRMIRKKYISSLQSLPEALSTPDAPVDAKELFGRHYAQIYGNAAPDNAGDPGQPSLEKEKSQQRFSPQQVDGIPAAAVEAAQAEHRLQDSASLGGCSSANPQRAEDTAGTDLIAALGEMFPLFGEKLKERSFATPDALVKAIPRILSGKPGETLKQLQDLSTSKTPYDQAGALKPIMKILVTVFGRHVFDEAATSPARPGKPASHTHESIVPR